MRGSKRVIRAVAIVTAVVGGLGAGVPSAGAVPTPDHDAFYSVPSDVASHPNGAILASRSVMATFYGLPDLATAWQVKYKTIDVHGRASADVATVLVPSIPWTGGGPRPLVSYQVAEDGIGAKCAPSYALQAGPSASSSNSEDETGLMELALTKGWALVVPDYEGPHSEFLGAAGEAHGVLDGVRAALSFSPAGLGSRTPVALWGYSGGALASDLAAQAQSAYAPGLRFAGIALGGLVTDLKATTEAFSGSVLGGAVVMGFAAADRSYPQAHVLDDLNDAGKQAVAGAQDDCINDAATQFPFATVQQYAKDPNVLDEPAVVSLFHQMSPLWTPGTPRAPIYDYHELLDEYAPIAGDRQLMARDCAAGVKVDHEELASGEHLAGVVAGAPQALAYLAARFGGVPAPDECAGLRRYAPPPPRHHARRHHT